MTTLLYFIVNVCSLQCSNSTEPTQEPCVCPPGPPGIPGMKVSFYFTCHALACVMFCINYVNIRQNSTSHIRQSHLFLLQHTAVSHFLNIYFEQ